METVCLYNPKCWINCSKALIVFTPDAGWFSFSSFFLQGAEAPVYEGPQRQVQAPGVRQQGDEEPGLLQVLKPAGVMLWVCVCVPGVYIWPDQRWGVSSSVEQTFLCFFISTPPPRLSPPPPPSVHPSSSPDLSHMSCFPVPTSSRSCLCSPGMLFSREKVINRFLDIVVHYCSCMVVFKLCWITHLNHKVGPLVPHTHLKAHGPYVSRRMLSSWTARGWMFIIGISVHGSVSPTQ